MNIKQSNSDSKIENLTNHIHSQQEKINIVSEDLKKFSDKLLVIEEDLSNLKEASADILELKHIQNGLSDYAASLKTGGDFVTSGSNQIRVGFLVTISRVLLL